MIKATEQVKSVMGGLLSKYSCPQKDPVQVTKDDPNYVAKPFVDGKKTFFGGEIKDYKGKSIEVTSPIIDAETKSRTVIGNLAQMTAEEAKDVLGSAKKAWKKGQGEWPQMKPIDRINAIKKVMEALKERREDIVKVLMWEICKSKSDAGKEFDRTMTFIDAVIEDFQKIDANETWQNAGGYSARVRRAAIGITLCLGAFNYPFNETYATLIPALLAGNVIIMKIPNTGGLAHVLTMEVYAKILPPGAINFFAGSGRETMGPLMETGEIDAFAFIGGSSAADSMIKSHPNPHRLKVFLQLEGKNLGLVMPDADLDEAVDNIAVGSTNYNGQRCTAIKLTMVHSSVADQFLEKFHKKINELKWGLPWTPGVEITPLPVSGKPEYLAELIADAVQKGAKVVNEQDGGGDIHGNLVRPTILFPVRQDMRIFHEEQFGPVIPIAIYDDLEGVYEYLAATPFGQQAAIFTADSSSAAPLVDILSTTVGKININTQCGRSPDVFPFSARRSSALGTMSVTEAIREFTVETVVACKANSKNEKILKDLEKDSKFLSPMKEKNVYYNVKIVKLFDWVL